MYQMSHALKIYEAFRDDDEKARVLAEAFEDVEQKLLPIQNAATREDLSGLETSLNANNERLSGELRSVDAKIDVVEERLSGKITQTVKDSEERLNERMHNAEVRTIRWNFAFRITQFTALLGVAAALFRALGII